MNLLGHHVSQPPFEQEPEPATVADLRAELRQLRVLVGDLRRENHQLRRTVERYERGER